MKTRFLALALTIAAGSAQAAYQRNTDPNWPCQQIKVPDLSVAAVWTGPSLDAARATWSSDPQIADLARRLSQRRVPLDQAETEVAAFAKQAGSDRQAKLVALFAGLFDILDQQRASVIAGLDRFGERQKVLAANLRSEGEALRALQSGTDPDPAKTAELTQQITWDTQIFEERRQSLSFACDVPNAIEQRLFGLARAIQQALG